MLSNKRHKPSTASSSSSNSSKVRRVILIHTPSAFSQRGPRQRKVYEIFATRKVFEVWQGVVGGEIKHQRSKLKNATSILESTVARKVRDGYKVCADYHGERRTLHDTLPEDVQRLVFRYLDLPSLCRMRCTSDRTNTLVDSSAHIFPAYTKLRLRGLRQLTGALLSSWAPEVRELSFVFDFRNIDECAKRDRIFELVAGCPSLQVLNLRKCQFPEKFEEYGDIVPEIRSKLGLLVRDIHFCGALEDDDLGNFEKLANAQNNEKDKAEESDDDVMTPYRCKVLVSSKADERTQFPAGERPGVFYVSVLPLVPSKSATEFLSAAQIVG